MGLWRTPRAVSAATRGFARREATPVTIALAMAGQDVAADGGTPSRSSFAFSPDLPLPAKTGQIEGPP